MAYADQSMSTRKAVSIGIVALLHILLGYAFITGLALNVIKKAAKDLNVIDVKDTPPPEEKPPPPPPPDTKLPPPPPIVAPPPIVQTQTIAPPMVVSPAPPIPAPVITQTAPPAPPAPVISQAANASGDPSSWITNDDYPPGPLRDGKEGVSRIAWEINETGRVENCHVTGSSGSPELDDAACKLLTRRGRYKPAKDQSGKPIRSSSSRAVRWQIPKD